MVAPCRWFWLVFVGLSPCGCALQFGSTEPAADPGDGIRVPKESKFASLVRAPGETVSLTGAGPVVAAGNALPSSGGPEIPPAKGNDPVPVDPPAPVGGGGFWPPSSSAPVNEPFVRAAQAAWDGRPDRVADALRPLDKATQEAVRPILLAGANLALGSAGADPKMLHATAAQLRTALAAVERRAELRVENARIVQFAYGYRWYDVLPENYSLRPGEYVYFYAEVTPLALDALPGGGFGTHVAYTLKVTDGRGQPVLLVDGNGQRKPVVVFEEKTDKSRGAVWEKHVSIGFAGPHAAGRYSAELEARDQHTGRVAKQAVEFRVGGR